MLNSLRNDARLISYLETDIATVSTVLGPTPLEIYLGGESDYEFTASLANAAQGDGMKLRLTYTGTAHIAMFTEIHAVSPGGSSFTLGDTLVDTQLDQVWHIKGVIRTQSPGKLYLEYANNTFVIDVSPLLTGSYIAAKRY